MKIEVITKFEENKNISINVFVINNERKQNEIAPIRITKENNLNRHIRILMIQDSSEVNNLYKQASKHQGNF